MKNNERDSSDSSDKDAIQEAAMARAADRRERHQQRPLIVRVLVAAAGVLLAVAGLLLLWVPELGLLLLLAGFRMLSLEFEWAAKAQGWIEWRFRQLRNWFERRSLTVKVGLPLLLVATVVFVLLWFVF